MRLKIVSIICLLGLLGGCNMKLRDGQELYRGGDVIGAAEKFTKYADSAANNENTVIAYLEKGNVLRNLGQYAQSNAAFEIADQRLEQIDAQPDLSLSRQGMSAISNPNALTYRGTNYDRIMLSTFRALNYLALGDLDGARVEMRKAYQRQAEAVERNAKRIEKAQAAAAEKDEDEKKNYDVEKARADPQFQKSYGENFDELNKYEAYADYVNPFAEFLQGIYFTHAGVDGDDLERGRLALTRAAEMAPDNPFLAADVDLAQQIAAGSHQPEVTYIIFETGVAPSRIQTRIPIPLFLVTNAGPAYASTNFPRLKFHEEFSLALEVNAAGAPGGTCSTAKVCDMDGIVAQEFKNELPIILTQAMISSATKAAIAYGVKEAARNTDTYAYIFTLVAASAYQEATNEADLRTWATLPKQFQYARIPTPQDRKITLTAAGAAPITVDLSPGQVNVVWVRSITPAAPLQLAQFKLK